MGEVLGGVSLEKGMGQMGFPYVDSGGRELDGGG